MNKLTLSNQIRQTLTQFTPDNLAHDALRLFDVLGYHHDEVPLIYQPAEFADLYDQRLNRDLAMLDHWQTVAILFQLTDDKIKQLGNLQLFETRQPFNNTLIYSYLFLAIELKPAEYTRTDLANITRAVNRLFRQPVIMLFKYDNLLTLAIIHHRIHERDSTKDVLEKVTLIKDINLKQPHRGQVEILADVALSELKQSHPITNFGQLQQAWQETLNISVLNKRFYEKLSRWYYWAMEQVSFPDDMEKNKDIRNATNLIRLITRLIFVWFIKEKGLVPDTLFDPRELAQILKNFDRSATALAVAATSEDVALRENPHSYYQAILQNLFFGTLNKKMGERKFAVEGDFLKQRNEYDVKTLFRYANQFAIDEATALAYFKDIPFLNGGLFDCLDKGNICVDGFSRNPKKQAIVPDFLFFAPETEYDLNGIYGTKGKTYKVMGLIELLNSYKFTVAENTPIEEEVALDPELLGKVFENLLASYNPETQTTARKQTGSFYTPREIVEYMVDESLKQYLQTQTSEVFKTSEVSALLSYDNMTNPFDPTQTERLIEAIDQLKILDPACGSGAFPMGILHKLVHVLTKLDPNNELWRERQRQKALHETETAFQIGDKEARAQRLLEINEVFDDNASDYGRKLYLIENCLYGLDIQPIAIQIAKLRFFISLIIDQKQQADKENLGIRALPNLETKFVAANTLIGLEKPQYEQLPAGYDQIKPLQDQLQQLRHHYFSAKNRREKLRYQDQDKDLRRQIANKLKLLGFPNAEAEKMAAFDPYNQNSHAPFFDTEWMFGLTTGFDVVMGNPPYIKEYTKKSAFDNVRNSPYYQGKMDLWYLFACSGLDLLKKDGSLCFIATNNWVTNSGASKMRNKIIKNAKIEKLLDFGSFMIFESADIQTMVMLFSNSSQNENYTFDFRRLTGKEISLQDVTDLLVKKPNLNAEYLFPTIIKINLIDKPLTFSNNNIENILQKIQAKGNLYLDEDEVANGIHPHYDFISKSISQKHNNKFPVGQGIFALSESEKKAIPFTTKELGLIKPYYTTEQLGRYYGSSKNIFWLIYTDSRFKTPVNIKPYPNIKKHLDQFGEVITSDNKPYGLHRARNEEFFRGEKIIALRKCSNQPVFTFTDFDCYVSATFYVIKTKRVNQKYLTALLNSKLIAFWLRHKGKMQGNNYQIDKEPLLAIPVYNPTKSAQQPIITLVDQILTAKRVNPRADTSAWERQIDEWVYKLYGLTVAEVALVEGR